MKLLLTNCQKNIIRISSYTVIRAFMVKLTNVVPKIRRGVLSVFNTPFSFKFIARSGNNHH